MAALPKKCMPQTTDFTELRSVDTAADSPKVSMRMISIPTMAALLKTASTPNLLGHQDLIGNILIDHMVPTIRMLVDHLEDLREDQGLMVPLEVHPEDQVQMINMDLPVDHHEDLAVQCVQDLQL